MKDFDKILVTSALPYANGAIHLGHLAGAYLPADVYVRYQRLKKRDVLFICGTDEHGVPITIAAEKEGVSPRAFVDRWYEDHKASFAKFGISFDNFSRTSLPQHYETAQDFFLNLYKKGFLVEKSAQQFFCVHCDRFLADRYVEGACPKCGAEGARGDQCENCGSSLDQVELINPYCKTCGAKPEMRSTAHLFLKLHDFQSQLEQWLNKKTGWKDNVLNYCRGWFSEGLENRAVTRDLTWGVPVPLPEYEGKVIYVWFEAPIGYISATKEWAEKRGEPDRWRDYWLDEHTKLVHFIGKDNIVFHAIIWPAMLFGYDKYILPDDIPANEFLTIEGEKLSTSRNFAVWLHEYLEQFEPDPLRYWLAANAPETKDADFSWKDFQHRNNNELADILGNFINRSTVFIKNNFNGVVPERGELDALDRTMLDALVTAQREVGECFENFQIRKAANVFMDLARLANKYFNDKQPWLTLKTDTRACATTMNICTQTVKTLAVLQQPILPFSAEKTWRILGLPGQVSDQFWDDAGTPDVPAGLTLGRSDILFAKIENARIERERNKLLGASSTRIKKEEIVAEDTITFEEFKRIDMRVAKVVAAERVEGTQKLLKMQVAIGEEQRQIVSGIAHLYDPAQLIGKTIVVVVNLKPAKIRGIESNGMLLAAVVDDENLTLVTTDKEFTSGARVE